MWMPDHCFTHVDNKDGEEEYEGKEEKDEENREKEEKEEERWRGNEKKKEAPWEQEYFYCT